MASTVIRGAQIKDSTVQRHDLDTSTVGQAVVTKIVQGSGVTLSSTGADSGTGDVTVSTSAIPLASSSASGLMNQTSGNTTDFIDGTNNSQPLQPVIWSVRLRSFNAVGNPTFEVDQRNVGNSVNIGINIPLIDRWRGGGAGTWGATAQQKSAVGSELVVPGTNFQISRSYLRITLVTAQATLGAGDYMAIWSLLEGPSFRELQFDVHSCQLLVRSSVANLKFGLALQDSTGSRSLVKLCILGTANTWALISLPNLPIFPSAGTFSNAAGALSYSLNICLASGSTFTAAANDTWQSANVIGAVGQSNFAAQAVNSTFDIAFIQHEPGALCTTPIDCPFTQNLTAAQRYFFKSYNYAVKPGTANSQSGEVMIPAVANQQAYQGIPFKVTMAKTPTITAYDPVGGAPNGAYDLAAGAARTVSSIVNPGESGFGGVNFSTPSAAATNYLLQYTADTGW